MKTITKIKESSKAVAGTALLVGATIAGGAAMVSAQDSGLSGDLGDYPAPFIDDDGNVASTLVMGADAKATDVVAATEIAGQLGNDAFSSETQTVSVSGAGGSWSATNGVTLDTRNDDVYFGQAINSVRDTLTDSDLDVLADAEFRDDGGTTYDITHNLNVGTLNPVFDNSADEFESNDDPAMHIPLPSEGSVGPNSGSHVLNLQANIDTINVNEDNVAGEDIELFNREYTIAQDHEGSNDLGYLKLYGSQDTVDVETGESTTVTINGNEHTIEVVSTDAGNDQASLRVDGNLRRESLNSEFNVDGQDVRIDEIINVGANDDGQGIVQFAIGSEELHIPADGQIEDGDDDDIEGTYAEINGGDWTEGDGISSIDIYLGAEDDSQDALMSGETFSHSLFEQVEFHFGGLNPDAASDSDNSGEITFSNTGDDTATVDLAGTDGNSATIEFAHDSTDLSQDDGSGTSGQFESVLADSDDDKIHVAEGSALEEDEYFSADPGDFDHMWEVTSINRDTSSDDPSDFSSDDEAEINLRDAVTGNTVTVDLDIADDEGNSNTNSLDTSSGSVVGDEEVVYEGTEIIDGQKYHFELEAADNPSDGTSSAADIGGANTDEAEFTVAWGGADVDGGSGSSLSLGSETTLYSALDTESDSAVAFTENVSLDTGVSSSSTGDAEYTVEVPSTESTDTKEVSIDVTDGSDTTESGDLNVNASTQPSSDTFSPEGSGFEFRATLESDELTFDVVGTEGASAVVLQPEDDNDEEHGYVVTPGVDTGDEEMSVGESGNFDYTGGPNSVSYSSTTQTLESDDDVEAGYNFYGTYTTQDTDDQGDFTLNIPMGQSTVGAAVTGMDGELSAEAGGSGSVDTMSPTGWPAQSVALDSDDYVSQVKNNKNLILVGGPAANSLTQELADANKTWSTSDYTEGEGLLQLVPEAFNEDHDALVVAGYSGEDTREAGRFLSNYGQHEEALSGESQVTISTAEGSVVQ